MPESTMTYSGPQIALPTAVGEVEVTWTDANHAHVSANASSGHGAGDVEFRGRHWYVSIDLYADANEGPWGEALNPGAYRHEFTESGAYGNKTIAPTYRAKIVAAITEAVAAYVTANPQILIDAERNNLTHKLEKATKNCESLTSDLLAARAVEKNLQDSLRKLA